MNATKAMIREKELLAQKVCDLSAQIDELKAALRDTTPEAGHITDAQAVQAQAARIRDLVSENCQLKKRLESTGIAQDIEAHQKERAALYDQIALLREPAKQCFFALALGYFGRGATLDEALINLQKAGCKKDAPIAVDLFIGDDKPTVINGGLNVEYKSEALRIRIGLFKSLDAAFRNLREP